MERWNCLLRQSSCNRRYERLWRIRLWGTTRAPLMCCWLTILTQFTVASFCIDLCGQENFVCCFAEVSAFSLFAIVTKLFCAFLPSTRRKIGARKNSMCNANEDDTILDVAEDCLRGIHVNGFFQFERALTTFLRASVGQFLQHGRFKNEFLTK